MAQKKRLAETLVEEGLITEAQLQSSLQRQLVMGGKIGTNLIELKYITDEQLEKALSKTYMIPHVFADAFLDIPSDTIHSIPKEIAIRHRIIPVKKEHKNIIIAMENPNDVGVIDELSFMTGCRITTVVASEVKIALALEKYYEHPRDLRYIEILRPREEEFVIERNLAISDYVPSPTTENKKEAKEEEESGWLSDMEPLDLLETYTPKEVPVAEKVVEKEFTKPVPREITLQETVHKLTSIETRDEAIEAVIDYISQYVDNVVFLVTSIVEAKAWKAKCKGVPYGNISDLKVNFGGPSVFLTVKNSEQAYYGEITSFPFDEDFLSKIGRKRPLRVYLVPIMVKTKLVSILYLDNGNKDIPSERIGEINSLIEKLSIAFEILLLKKKAEAKK